MAMFNWIRGTVILAATVGLIVGVAAVLGAVFVGWYFEETGLFELVATPIIVIASAALLAGQLHGHLTHLLLGDEYAPFSENTVGGLYSALLFLYMTWPIVLPVSASVSGK